MREGESTKECRGSQSTELVYLECCCNMLIIMGFKSAQGEAMDLFDAPLLYNEAGCFQYDSSQAGFLDDEESYCYEEVLESAWHLLMC